MITHANTRTISLSYQDNVKCDHIDFTTAPTTGGQVERGGGLTHLKNW